RSGSPGRARAPEALSQARCPPSGSLALLRRARRLDARHPRLRDEPPLLVAELRHLHREGQRPAAPPLLLVDLGDPRSTEEPRPCARRRAVEDILLLGVEPALLVHRHLRPRIAALH